MGNVELLPVRSAERVAVLLNANARSVSDALKRELENFVPPEDLYYSRCFDDARSIARQVLDKGYRTVLTGGGDGTFVGYVNCLFEQARQPSASTARGALKLMPVPAHEILMPRFGVLRLGTGNAVAEACSARVQQARVGVSWLWRQAGVGLRTVLLVGAGVVAAGTAYLAGPVVAAAAGQVWGWASGLAGWDTSARWSGRRSPPTCCSGAFPMWK